MIERNLGRKKFMWFACPNHRRLLTEVMAEIQAGTEPGTMEGCCLPACSPLLARHCLLNLFSDNGFSCPGMASPTVGLALPHWPQIQKIPHRFAHRTAQWRKVLSHLFPADSSFVSGGPKQTSAAIKPADKRKTCQEACWGSTESVLL